MRKRRRPVQEQLMAIDEVVLECYADKFHEEDILAAVKVKKNGHKELQKCFNKSIGRTDDYRYNKKRGFTFKRRPNILSLGTCPGRVNIHMSCKYVETLGWLQDAVLNGPMKEILQNAFYEFLGNIGVIQSEVELIKDVFLVGVDYSNKKVQLELAKATDVATKLALLRNERENMKTVFENPTLAEVRDAVILKAYLFRADRGTKETPKPTAHAFKYLAGVDKNFETTLKRPTVKSILKRPLENLLNKPELKTKLNSGVKWNVGVKVICIASLLGDIYIVTENKRNVIQRCDMNSLRKVPIQEQLSGTADKPTSPIAVTLSTEDIIMPENVKISYMEASEKEKGIFFMEESNETDGGKIWFWSKGEVIEQPRQAEQQRQGEQQRRASETNQLSPSNCMMVSRVGQSSEDEMRILLNITLPLPKKVSKDEILEIHPQRSKILLLPTTVHKPMSVIRNSKGCIFVSHGDTKRSSICKITNNGSKFLPYGDNPEGHPEKLNEPCSMTIDDDDRIYVADKGNNRILLLDSDMHLIKVLLDEEYHGIINPTLVQYSQPLNKLIVACENSIHIYGDREFQFIESPQGVGTKTASTSEEKIVKE